MKKLDEEQKEAVRELCENYSAHGINLISGNIHKLDEQAKEIERLSQQLGLEE